MTGFRAFLAKEFAETMHTWRIWVLPGFLLFSAISSPILTYFTPALMDALGSQGTGIAITVPDPTASAAYLEYIGNLFELVMLAMVIAYGGIVNSEVRSGTGALTLAKPLSRHAFVLGKWVSQLAVLLVAASLATAVCVGVTAVVLDSGPALALVAAAGLWFAYAVLMLSVMVLLSVAFRAPAAASGAGVGAYLSLVVLGQFPRLAEVTPAELPTAATDRIQGIPAIWVTPLLTTVVASLVLLLAALWLFSRREI
ncbi:MAG: ABC transporter permease subunit [Thermoleophilia bacterium]